MFYPLCEIFSYYVLTNTYYKVGLKKMNWIGWKICDKTEIYEISSLNHHIANLIINIGCEKTFLYIDA